MPVFNSTDSAAVFPPHSFFITATVAAHGTYNAVNSITETAACQDRTSGDEPNSNSSVPATTSLAVTPRIRATHMRQSSIPMGLKKNAVFLPIHARTEPSAISAVR